MWLSLCGFEIGEMSLLNLLRGRFYAKDLSAARVRKLWSLSKGRRGLIEDRLWSWWMFISWGLPLLA